VNAITSPGDEGSCIIKSMTMNKKYWITGFLLVMAALVHARQPAPAGDKLHFDTDRPRAGQTVSFDYSSAGGKLAGAGDIHAALLYYTDGKATGYYAQDLTLRPAGKEDWKGNFILPDSAVAFAIRLKSGKVIEDNNGRGYISLVYLDGAVRPEAYAGAALLFANGGSLLDLPNKADTALALLEKEFGLHPELRSKYEYAYYYNLVAVKKQEANLLMDKREQELLSAPNSSMADYKLAMRLLQLQKKKKAADSVLSIAAQKFPGSELAAQYDENPFYIIRGLDSMVSYYNSYNEKYLRDGARDPAAQTSSYFAVAIASRYLEKKDYTNAIVYTTRMYDEMADYRGFTYSRIALDLLKNNIDPVKSNADLSLADSLMKLALAGVDYELAHPEKFKTQGSTLSEWKEGINSYYYSSLTDSYGRILAQKGDLAAALKMQEKAVKLSHGANIVFNEHYVECLTRTGDVKASRSASEKFVKGGNASDSLRAWLKEAYIKEKGSDKGYDTYLAGLQSAARERVREEALKEKLDLPSKAFSIPDIDGNIVSLASLKGKVVIVDFWATWCGPCKASFPAMQMTIDKFKNDTNVVFLFVDTYESLPAEERLSSVRKFITSNKYPFTVLLDKVVDLEKRQYSVVSDYGVGGIPTKFIISPQGKIVFKAVGFDGNNEKLVTELSAYIDIAKGS
jgi:thiol-disulfide isomerase/thioredoxin